MSHNVLIVTSINVKLFNKIYLTDETAVLSVFLLVTVKYITIILYYLASSDSILYL